MTTLDIDMTDSLLDRFSNGYIPEPNSGCWLWIFAETKDGHGNFKPYKAHRFSWTAFNGPIPNDAWVLHKCDVPQCVNPKHLYLGNAKQNSFDRDSRNRSNNWQKLKTHCKNGHLFSLENTIIYTYLSKNTGRPYSTRQCRVCRKIRNSSRYN